MVAHHSCEDACDRRAVQRSLYRHALYELELASRSGCASKEAREVAERCLELLRVVDVRRSMSVERQ
jgi:hypothetical protein